MHVLVTGGCGFIGSHVVEYHLKKGDKVLAVDDLSTGSLRNIAEFKDHPNLHFENADILTWDGLISAAGWADRIYNMAAVVGVYRVLAEPIRVLATNIPGCERVLRSVAASAWRPRVLIASSSEVYGPGHGRAFEETDNIVIESAAQNRWNYAISKIADEAFGLSYARKLDLPITIFRLFNTVGPRQTGRYGMVLPRFVEQAMAGEPITVFGDGTQTRCFCDVRDVVHALDLLAQTPDSVGEIVNVGNDHELTMNELAELVKKITKSNSPIEHIPYEKAYQSSSFVDIMSRRPSLKKLEKLTQFKPKLTLEETIRDMADYLG